MYRFPLALLLLTSSAFANLFQSSSQQSYALNIPDTSIAVPPCQNPNGKDAAKNAAKAKKPKKSQATAPAACTEAAELKKTIDSMPKTESRQPETQKSVAP